MPRLMSVALTEDAVRERRKTVTRRAGWVFLQPGDVIDLCRKVMGRKRGQPLVRVARVRILSVRREPLSAVTGEDVWREGFDPSDLDSYTCSDELTDEVMARAFCRFFIDHMGGGIDQEVTRIEWEYLPTPPEWPALT